ncbi:MAG: isoprenylcysteine carboxylmethyltransferase family protein [Armatimonadota bacterium]|nr:MAG: isoprenylcysteine carboxylmethyltransferase family protein [Armatimonadota bacterium]
MAETVRAYAAEPTWKLALRGIVRTSLFAVLFISAGRIGWTRAWILFGLMLLTVAANLIVILRSNPRLLRERLKKDEASKSFDRVFMAVAIPVSLAILIVPGLDAVRFGWSSLPLGWLYVGAALHLLGDVPMAWAMATNPYLERTVRIQDDRGHTVITSGPYRMVRHPMYVGLLVMMAGWPLILGSVWTYVPVALLGILVVLRTAFEDRTLREELPGYAEYARRTRHRLLPGVW